jgi:hypothetical protein
MRVAVSFAAAVSSMQEVIVCAAIDRLEILNFEVDASG